MQRSDLYGLSPSTGKSLRKPRAIPASPDNSISLSTKQSPLITDFYGEKITNVDQYLQWKSIHQKLKQSETIEDNEEEEQQ